MVEIRRRSKIGRDGIYIFLSCWFPAKYNGRTDVREHKSEVLLAHGGVQGRVQEFVCVKVWGFALLILSNFIKYHMKMK